MDELAKETLVVEVDYSVRSLKGVYANVYAYLCDVQLDMAEKVERGKTKACTNPS
jgi:hypothetical protein